MAKAIALFSGRDTYGRWIDVAFREDGQGFHRWQEFNGYADGLVKWRKNSADMEAFDENAKTYPWGFKTLEGGKRGDLRLRLPN